MAMAVSTYPHEHCLCSLGRLGFSYFFTGYFSAKKHSEVQEEEEKRCIHGVLPWVIPGLSIAANALVSNESKPTERIQMADVTCHGLTSSATSNLKGKPGEMLAKHQADVDSQYLTNCHKLDRKMGVGPASRAFLQRMESGRASPPPPPPPPQPTAA